MRAALLALALVAIVQADMYLHNPRGSNNRLDEARRERNNANRMFDSQNNNRGGYNVGNLYYYEGSTLPIEWTNQHSCADQNNYCDVIIQYMCDSKLRDGSSTNTIPENPANCEGNNCNNDLEFGMHEDYDYYLNCRTRSRNMGLYTADRNLNGNTARFTRQNNNGQRRGYECPEERDYYPYWHPTPWRDVAILTNNIMRCQDYQKNSQNVQSRFYCDVPRAFITANRNNNNRNIPINREECELLRYPNNENGTNGTWTEVKPEAGLAKPDCVETISSRDNHLGNTAGGFPVYYNWTIPNKPHQHCALRVRYNISTADYEAWEDSSINGSLTRMNAQVYNGNGQGNLARRQISNVSDVYTQFNMNYDQARSRGYVFRQNPVVRPFPAAANGNTFGLQLAINTNQFGRTFQDRSHSFEIRKKPEDLECDKILNLNVRGKRGNIVQTFPGVEYDFVPNSLLASVGDCIHIQWTGSNTNPNNNDGQGRAGTDRSNMVLMKGPMFPEGAAKPDDMGKSGVYGHLGRSYPQHLNHTDEFLGFTFEDRQSMAGLIGSHMGGEMSELDDAGTYYDLGVRKVTNAGLYRYLCTRNNNFTNRSQKAIVAILDAIVRFFRLGYNGGVASVNNHTLEFGLGDLLFPTMLTLTQFPNTSEAIKEVQRLAPSGENLNMPANTQSDYISIEPHGPFPGAQRKGKVSMKLDDNTLEAGVSIYMATKTSSYSFVRMETTIVDGRAEAQTNEGGIFVAGSGVNVGLVVGLVVAGVVVLLLALMTAGVIVYFVARPDKWKSTKEGVKKTQMKFKRSFANKV